MLLCKAADANTPEVSGIFCFTSWSCWVCFSRKCLSLHESTPKLNGYILGPFPILVTRFLEIGREIGNCCIIPLKTKKPQSASQNPYESAFILDFPAGCAAQTPSVPDRAYDVLRWRPGCREEPPGSQDHRCKSRGVQHLGVPVQQLGE